jgi:hypothetical protein
MIALETQRLLTKSYEQHQSQLLQAAFRAIPRLNLGGGFFPVYRYLLRLKEEGVSNIRSYFSTYPDKFIECIKQLRVVDINNATLKLYKAKSKTDLVNSMDMIFRDEAQACLLESIVALSGNKHSFEGQGVNYDLNGNPITIKISWTVTGSDISDYEKVIVVIQDMSRLVQTRTELKCGKLYSVASLSSLLKEWL